MWISVFDRLRVFAIFGVFSMCIYRIWSNQWRWWWAQRPSPGRRRSKRTSWGTVPTWRTRVASAGSDGSETTETCSSSAAGPSPPTNQPYPNSKHSDGNDFLVSNLNLYYFLKLYPYVFVRQGAVLYPVHHLPCALRRMRSPQSLRWCVNAYISGLLSSSPPQPPVSQIEASRSEGLWPWAPPPGQRWPTATLCLHLREENHSGFTINL